MLYPSPSSCYTLSLHDALPISWGAQPGGMGIVEGGAIPYKPDALKKKQDNLKNRMLVKVTNDPHRFDTDRKSTRLNSSHLGISYAVFCLKKKKKEKITTAQNTT